MLSPTLGSCRPTLVERISVGGPALRIYDFVVDPRIATGKAEFLELMQRKSREVEEQNDLDRLEVTEESPRDCDGCKRGSEIVPVYAGRSCAFDSLSRDDGVRSTYYSLYRAQQLGVEEPARNRRQDYSG